MVVISTIIGAILSMAITMIIAIISPAPIFVMLMVRFAASAAEEDQETETRQ
jgi:hypothetical protein